MTHHLKFSTTLPYHPPFDWLKMIAFFQLRQLKNVEEVSTHYYRRVIKIGKNHGWLEVTPPQGKHALRLTVHHIEPAYKDTITKNIRRMFDLDADINAIYQHLSKDERLQKVINNNLGVRLPGCWDIFEFSIRAILGQQVSVKAATTLAARIAEHYGEKLDFNNSLLTRCFPTIEQLSNAKYTHIGLTQSRIATLQTWLSFIQQHPNSLYNYSSLDELEKQLVSLKGIGPWTVNYIAMRGLSEADAFPSNDLGIIKALSSSEEKISMKEITKQAAQWRPFRAYAAIFLWLSLAT